MTILATETVIDSGPNLDYCIGWFCFFIFFLMIAFSLPLITENKKIKLIIIIGIIFSAVGFTILVANDAGFAPWNQIKTHEEYIVTLDDTVSVTDFIDKYEILEHNGDLYVIKEIENEKV